MSLKNNYLFIKLLKWVNEKCKNFNIYSFKKIKKTPGYIINLHLCTKIRVWQTEISN